MASKGAWGFLYTLARLDNAFAQALKHLSDSATSSYTSAFRIGVNALKTQDLTTTICMTGTAMQPTLNSAQDAQEMSDRLLMRRLPKLTGSTLDVGDVVAFKPPLGIEEDYLVRRIAAVEGEEMISDDPEDVSFKLPEAHYWVLADNEELKPKEASDSRTFGPLPSENILGRIIYYVRSQTDHGAVSNGKYAFPIDKAVLSAELDIEKLLDTQC